jgi:hypothetical protein
MKKPITEPIITKKESIEDLALYQLIGGFFPFFAGMKGQYWYRWPTRIIMDHYLMVDKGRFGKCARSAVVGELLCDLQVGSSTLFSHKKGPLSVLFNSHGLWPFLDPVVETSS